MTAADLLAQPFGTLPVLMHAHAAERGDRIAIADETGAISYADFDRLIDRVAATLQRDGLAHGAAVAIVAAPSIRYAAAFIGTVLAGGAATPLSPSATPASIAAMVRDCRAGHILVDEANALALAGEDLGDAVLVLLAGDAAERAVTRWEDWLAPADVRAAPVAIAPDDAFNIIYSSGTTGSPKGIVQSHAMRWAHISRNAAAGFDTAVTMIATPLYSNTTLVCFLPTLGWGGTAVLMAKFDARRFLELATAHRATHTMLVPVQYRRLMALPEFDRFDLSAFRFKTSTSAPFDAALKADVVARWPGLLVEYYGMTEGGASCALNCSAHPDKLHTVGQPLPGHEVRLIGEDGREVAAGEAGEIVGRSPTMMNGYLGRAEATREAEWTSPDGRRFIRHGDVGRFDADGFLVLMDRKKDLIISGGFNIYPSDLEAVLARHPAVAECAVIGMPSDAWGETPVGLFVRRPGADDQAEDVMAWVNGRLGRTQRISALHELDDLPRSTIGKILKRELRDRLLASVR